VNHDGAGLIRGAKPESEQQTQAWQLGPGLVRLSKRSQQRMHAQAVQGDGFCITIAADIVQFTCTPLHLCPCHPPAPGILWHTLVPIMHAAHAVSSCSTHGWPLANKQLPYGSSKVSYTPAERQRRSLHQQAIRKSTANWQLFVSYWDSLSAKGSQTEQQQTQCLSGSQVLPPG
jgi:hypothetical protein